MTGELLKIRGLRTVFSSDGGVAAAVDRINLDLKQGETHGLVGESGCGKTVTALSTMRLVADPPGRSLPAKSSSTASIS